MAVATSNDGQPDIALKGSLLVWDKDHVAWWERRRSETLAGLLSNPRVAVFVRNPTRDRRALRFYGTARDPRARRSRARRPERHQRREA